MYETTFGINSIEYLNINYISCRKTAVCNGDQLLHFSVPELFRSQSSFSTHPCSSAGLEVGERSAVMGLTPCMLCAQIYCVLCIVDY